MKIQPLQILSLLSVVLCNGTEASIVDLGSLDGHEYFYETGSFLTFDVARQAAQTVQNRDLVSITSQAENNFLAAAISTMPNEASNLRAAWIGLSRPTASDSFAWVTNEPASYLNWRPAGVGFPWDEPTGETAVVMYINQPDVPLGLWADTYSVGAEPFNAIFETTPVPLPTAALLFGSALAGLGLIGKKKRMGSGLAITHPA